MMQINALENRDQVKALSQTSTKSRSETSVKLIAKRLCFAVIALNIAIFCRWLFGVYLPAEFIIPRIKLNGTIAFIFCGVSLLLCLSRNLNRRKLLFADILAVAAMSISLLTLLQYVTGWDFRIDQLLVADIYEPHRAWPGRLSPNTSLAIFFLAFGIFSLGRKRWPDFVSRVFAILSGSLGLIAFLGYIFSAEELYHIRDLTRFSIYSAFSIVSLAICVFLQRPQIGVVKILLKQTPSGSFARKMFTAALFLPAVLGWFGEAVQHAGYLSDAMATALVAAATVALFLGLAWRSAKALDVFEGALLESESQFRSMANSMPQLSWMTDSRGNIIWFNQRWYDYTGMSPDDIPNWWQKVHSDETLGASLPGWKKAIKNGEAWDDVIQLRGADGRFRWFLSRAVPVRNEKGEILRWLGSNTDIEEQRQTERALVESKDRYATLMDAIPHLVWTALPNGSCDYVSEQWVKYTGIAAEKQLGTKWLEVIHPDDIARTRGHWAGAITGEHDYDIEYRILGADGNYRWFKTRGIPVRDDFGNITYWFGTCTDIHEHRLMADELLDSKLIAENANRAKTQFLANMSHEIRTPVGAIMGFTELLKNPNNSSAEQNNYTLIVERNSQNLLRLIDDVLDLSKVEAGKIALEMTEFAFPDFMADFYSSMSLKAKDKGISLVLGLENAIPSHIVTDQLRLRQILVNIVGNAIKFTDAGKVEIQLRFDHPYLHFKVSDTGAGIPETSIKNLFQAFGQADPSMTRKYGGTGLGLILSKRLSEALGGGLMLRESKAGVGSTFVASIQTRSKNQHDLVGQESLHIVQGFQAQTKPESAVLEGLRVLLVEDSPDNRTLIQIYLKNTGAILEFAEDGKVGFERAISTKPDLILMDIQMPKMDGHQATKKLRECGFTNPIIALTAHAMREERDKCFASGCTDYLTKPIRKDHLIETLKRYGEMFKFDSRDQLAEREPSENSFGASI